MAAEARLTAVLVLFSIAPVIIAQAEELCAYFTAIPREPRPDRELPDFTGTTWATRPLLPPPDREDICIDVYSQSGSTGTQTIHIEEEIEGDVIIAQLNYNGNEEPYVGVFWEGPRNLLLPVIRQIEGRWFLVITARQDYETPSMRRYMFEVNVPGETLVARVSLGIVNIDDNAPVIQVTSQCTVPELGTVPRPTSCVYEVTDVDGEISTRFMRFEISSDRGDEATFSIQATPNPTDWTRMTMTLHLEKLLDFELNALHIFSVTAFDSLPNTHTVTMMVQVENVEHRPPRWVEIWAVQQFDEKTNQSFTLRAIDGDTGINKRILYKLDKNENYSFFDIEMDEETGGAVFKVSPIDRDFLKQEVFQLSVIAYKFDNEALFTVAPIVIIVNDVNDQTPTPLHPEYHISIMEETPMTLAFKEELAFNDIDLGEHAQYEVTLESVEPPGVAEAFYIAPSVGYQRQTFTMGTINHALLDYEVPEYQKIHIRIKATDLNNPSFVGVASVYIDLINWNDELPTFAESTVTVQFNETEGLGFPVTSLLATDRDIGDRVVHSLMGNANQYLAIDRDTGDIIISMDNAFDYHRQSELFVQVRADDTLMMPYHTTTTQLVIQLLDVNNTPPTIRLPRESPRVEENVPAGHVITREVTASDPDTTARLVFEIDWSKSYATKQGRETPPEEFHNCVKINTIFRDPEKTGNAVGEILAQEIRPGVTIDFEEFEVLYLIIRVVDLETVDGDDYDELSFTIIIEDMNDNCPVWASGTLETEFRVREASDSGTVIGSVLSTDIDGPLYNQIRYSILPKDGIPDDLVKIDALTGQIVVDKQAAIDADDPPRQNLYYTVIASDQCTYQNQDDCPKDKVFWETKGDITIHIIDVNNKIPVALTDKFDVTVEIYENATSGDLVQTVLSSDMDRDVIYNTVRYQINYAVNSRLRDFFAIDLDTGELVVEYTTDEVLDRDGDEPEHRIFINLFDNFFTEGDGTRNQIDLEMLIVLLDVNDNAPELPPPSQLSWSESENLSEGHRILPEIYAPDRDQPDHDNSRVAYEILSLIPRDRDITPPELFKMINIDYVTGELETAMPLKGYWGTYGVHILAYDHGIPQQSSNETYEFQIRPYNYQNPRFVFPTPSSVIRLAREGAVINGLLTKVGGETLERIQAIDEDGLHAGTVTFTVVGDAEAQTFLNVMNEGENRGSLVLNSLFAEEIKEFQITIRASDAGTEPGPLYSEVTFGVAFIPTQGEPVFETTTAAVAFFELENGLRERFQLPLAVDYKNHLCTTDCYDIFYRIANDPSGKFAVEATTNIIYLTQPLDRAESLSHTVTIAASNVASASHPPLSVLTVTVTVREENPRPNFEKSLYSAGISTTDTINRELLRVKATHNEGLDITYAIDHDTMFVHSSLEAVKDSAFILNNLTGALVLNIQPTASMHGMFEFEIVATDTAEAADRTKTVIYIISDMNRVYFLFQNTLQQVEQQTNFIAQTFTAGFGMQCNIDQVLPASNSAGVALDSVTEVRAHFIQNDVPVDANVIEELRSDTILLTSVQRTLSLELLILNDLVTGPSPAVAAETSRRVVWSLAALAALLACACAALLLVYLVRTRTLNRRLEALSTTKFGSLDSGLNRAGVAVPGTNKHAVEGSNPMWNEQTKAPDFDAISDISNDSDLIGIEDLPQFQQNYQESDHRRSNTSSVPTGVHQPSYGSDDIPNFSTPFKFKGISNSNRPSHPSRDSDI